MFQESCHVKKKKKHLPAGPGSAGSWMEVGEPINENNSAVDIFDKQRMVIHIV